MLHKQYKINKTRILYACFVLFKYCFMILECFCLRLCLQQLLIINY